MSVREPKTNFGVSLRLRPNTKWYNSDVSDVVLCHWTKQFSLVFRQLKFFGQKSLPETSMVQVADFKLELPRCQEGALVPRGGIEPPTRGFSVRCSTD